MSWRLKHRLFGWHYAHLQNTATDIVRRVRWTADSRPYVVYFGENIVFLDDPRNGWNVSPLTLPQEKLVQIQVLP